MGATRTRRIGSTATLGILTAIVVILYLVTVTLVAVWWSKEERKLANKTVARIERQLEICKKEQ
jgi:preprotein translocase subunit SecG